MKTSREVGLAEQRLRLVPGVAERPVEEGEQDDERGDLNRDDRPAVALQPLARPVHSPHEQSVTNSSRLPRFASHCAGWPVARTIMSKWRS